MKRNFVAIVGVVSVVVLGVAIFLRPDPSLPEATDVVLTPSEELVMFLDDKMNYGVRFSIILAEKRVERTSVIAREHPALEALALEVADSLRARLERKAVIE